MQDSMLDTEARAGQGTVVYLSPEARRGLAAVAADRCMEPGDWIASLVSASLSGRPKWNPEESRHLADVSAAMGQIVPILDSLPAADSVTVLSMGSTPDCRDRSNA
jgi:hypothetical protein